MTLFDGVAEKLGDGLINACMYVYVYVHVYSCLNP
jgi:hypothetical protein